MKISKYYSEIILALFVLVLCSSLFITETSARMERINQFSPSQELQRTDISGLLAPRIDGFIDFNSPTGYMDEWEDALLKSVEFSGTNTSRFNLDVHIKVVSGTLYLAFTSTDSLEEVSLEIDCDKNGASSTDDVKLTQEKEGQFTVEVYEGSEWILLPEHLGMTSATSAEKAASMIDIGSMAIEDDDGASTTVEISYVLEDTEDGDTDFKLVVLIGTEFYSTQYLNEYFLFPPFIFRNVGIHHIEVTQASQNENSSLPLVRNKESLARVFVSNQGRYATSVEVKLTGYTFGLFRPMPLWTISTTFTAPRYSSFDREVLADSANFRLPDVWTSYPFLILRAEVSPIFAWDTVSSDNKKNGFFAFTETHDLNVYYIRVNEGTDTSPDMKSYSEVLEQTSNMTVTYPMANPRYIELGSELIGPWSGTGAGLITELNEILDHLWWLIPEADQIHGLRVNGGGRSDPSWYYGRDSFAAWSGYGTSQELTMAHEICHNLGPGSGTEQWGRHVSGTGYGCGASGPDATWQGLYTDGEIHELGWHPGYGCGYEPGVGFLVPTNTPDFMTYCQSGTFPTKWTSGYRWNRLFDRLKGFVAGEPAAPFVDELNLASPTSDVRIVRGFLNFDGSAVLRPSLAFPSSRVSDNFVLANVTPTAYLEVEYSNATIQQIPLYANFIDHEGQNITQSAFTVRLTEDDEIDAIRIIDPMNTTLDEYASSGFTASGLIFAPTSFIRGTAGTVSWNISMSNSTSIYHYPQYSPDGVRWYPLGQPTLGDSTPIVFRNVPGSDTAQFRLLLSDGIATKIIAGPTFSLPGLASIVAISGEAASLSTTVGSFISLSASGWDPETGAIPSSSLVWKLCENGVMSEIATGESLKLRFSEPGVYRIGVTYEDDDGIESMDCVEITVLEPVYLDTDAWNAFRLPLQPAEVAPYDPVVLVGSGVAVGIVIMAVVAFAIKRR